MIEFQDVYLKIGDNDLLKNINGQFKKHTITTLIGPSGAGKTTLLKICNGLLSPTTGQIYLNKQAIKHITPTTLRKQVGIALQYAPIIPSTVFDNSALPSLH